MDERSKPAETRDPRVEAAIRDYLEGVDRGEAVNREEFISGHAEIADALRSFFAAEEPLRKMAVTKISEQSAGISTRSIAAQGQETVPPESQPDRRPGTTGSGLAGQFGRYQIIRALGSGAMGAVYLAQDTQLKRNVAIKTPHFEDDPTGELLKRFYREAEAAATLLNANICPVYDVGQIDGKHFISMAYIEGRPLSDLIHGGKAQNERQIVTAIHKLAKALQQAHDHGIVHRDLKPANIMVNKQGEPVIMDFGLARKRRAEGEASLTHSGMLLGSPAYMSPEQIEGDPESVGPASDQYSLGVVLYEMLTRQLPFRGSVVNVLAQILTKDLTWPSELRPGLDPRIEAVCLRMMAKKASNRFPSMKAVAEELYAILKSPAAEPIAAEKSPTASRPPATPAPSPGDARASQIRKSVKQRLLTESDMTSLEELVRKCLRRRDYDQVIQIIERIPEERRNAELQTLLEMARGKADEIAFLICEIDEAERLNDGQTALKKAELLLKVKPGHHRALEIQEKFSGYGDGGAARIGLVDQFRRPLNDGGWIPWSVLAFGLAVFGVMTGVIVIYLGRTAVVIDIKDPGVEVAVKGTTLTVTGPDKQSVKVEPGDQELKITYAGLETITKSFTLKRGDKKTVTVSIVDKEIVAQLENEILPPTLVHEEKASNATDGGKKSSLPLSPAHGEQTTSTLPSTFNSRLGMEFVLVPKGKSWLGGGDGKPGEKEVVIAQDFYLGKYEVTQQEWRKVPGLTPSWFSRTGGGKDAVKDIADADLERFPVEIVSWDDAQVFLERLNKLEPQPGWVYRLPTVAEWEYACRGGPMADKFESAYDFYFDKPSNLLLHEQANFFEEGKGLKRTCKVGSYRPNRLGLYDMHGNVCEWCDDAEKTGWGAPGRARRGGDWCSYELYSRAWAGVAAPPNYRHYGGGFRVARVPVGNESVAPPLSEQRKTETPATMASGDPDRRAAQWVLSIGGTIKIDENGNEREIKPGGELPRGAFELTVVDLHGNRKVTDAGLAHFRDCRSVTTLYLWDTQASDAGLAYFKDCKKLETLLLNGAQTDMGLAYFKDCKALTNVGLGGIHVTDAGLAVFKNCTSLTNLDLGGGAQVSDAGLANFKDCKKLTSLILWGTKVTDAGLAFFKDRQNVHWLHLGGTQVSDAGLAYFQNCKNITGLDLHDHQGNPRVTDAGIVYFKGCDNMTLLLLSGARVTDAGLRHFKDCKRLTDLWLDNTEVTDTGLAYFDDCKRIESLRLASTQVTDAGLTHFKDCKNLTRLWLDNTVVTNASLQRLASLQKLEYLCVKKTNVTEAGVKKLAAALPRCKIEWDGGVIGPNPNVATTNAPRADGIPNSPTDPDRRAAEWALSIGGSIKISERGREMEMKADDELPTGAFELTVVNLGGNPNVTNAGLAVFKDCKNLRRLDLNCTKVTDAGLSYFKHCKDVKELSLWTTQVSDAGLAYFKDCKNLTELSLSHTRVSDAGLALFKNCKNLTGLGIGDDVSDAGLAYFRDCKSFTSLDLSGAPKVTDAGLAYFKDCKDLKWLILWGTQVTDTGLAHFRKCENLTLVLLDGLQVTDAGLAFLKDCKNLTNLGLANTQVTDKGLAYLTGCKSVESLGLNGTNVTDVGLAYFKDCKKLTNLSLDNTEVTDVSLDRLTGFRKLTSLSVKKTLVKKAGVKKLAAALPRCKVEWDGGVIAPKA